MPLVPLSSCAPSGADNEAARHDAEKSLSFQSLAEVDELPGASLTFDVAVHAIALVSLREAKVVEGAKHDSTEWDPRDERSER